MQSSGERHLLLREEPADNNAGRLDGRLLTEFPSSRPDEAGARPAVLGSLWVIATTAVLVPTIILTRGGPLDATKTLQ